VAVYYPSAAAKPCEGEAEIDRIEDKGINWQLNLDFQSFHPMIQALGQSSFEAVYLFNPKLSGFFVAKLLDWAAYLMRSAMLRF
jgi:hypothetical protein